MTQEEIFKSRDWSVSAAAFGATVADARVPLHPPVKLAGTISEFTRPVLRHDQVAPSDSDLTRNSAVDGEPVGARIVVAGQVTDEDGIPLPDVLVEIW
jgi:protocatechuate 3,4-dioxygenase beta subunit